MDKVVAGLRTIEEGVRSSDRTLRSAPLGQQFQKLANGAREMDSRTSKSITPLKALRQEFRALRAESRNIEFGDVGDAKKFRAAAREVNQYVTALESLESQVRTDTSLEREFSAILKQQQRIARQRVEMAEEQRKAMLASQRVAGASAVQAIGQSVFSPLATFEKDSIQILTDFNDQMSQVQAVSGLTAQQLAAVRQKAKDLGAQTRFSASEAASGFIFLAQAGYTVDQQMAAIDGTLNLASAGALGLAEATDIVVASLGGFQLSADVAAHVSDVLAKGAAAGATNVQQIGEALKYAGPPAKAFGSTVEETTAMIALLSNAGIKGSQAGTALRAGFLRLAAPPREAKKAIEELGLQIADASGSIRPMTDIIGDLQQGLSKVSDERKIQMVKALVGTEASASFLYMIENADQLARMGDGMLRASEGMGEAARQSKVMEQNLGGSFRAFASALEGVKIALIEPIEPILRFVVDTGSAVLNFVTGLPAPLRVLLSVGVGLTTALAGLAAALGAVGVFAFGMQQAIATAAVGMVALRSNALPLTGFFQTAIAGVSGSPAAGLRQLAGELSRLPNPVGLAAAAIRAFGATISSAMLSPLGLAIAGIGLLLLILSKVAPGVDLLGSSLMLLSAPFKILGGFLRGFGSGFNAALKEIFGKNLDPVAKDFSDFVSRLAQQLQDFETSAETFGKTVGKAIAQIFSPIAKAQAQASQWIVGLWIGTVAAIINTFNPLVRVAQAIGQTLVSLLAENSPGPTAQIREKWSQTVQWIGNLLARLPEVARSVGTAIVSAFRWSSEAAAELMRGYLERRVSRSLIGMSGTLGKVVRHRFGEVLGEVFTAPFESGIENQVLSTFMLVINRIEESIAIVYENLSIMPNSARTTLDVLAQRFAQVSGAVATLENKTFQSAATLSHFIGVAGTASNILARYPRLMGQMATGLRLFGGFATGIGLILTLGDRLRLLRVLLLAAASALDRLNIPSGWLTPLIGGIDGLIIGINSARNAVISLLRNLLFGQWSAAADQLSGGFAAAVMQVSKMWGRLGSKLSGGNSRITQAIGSVLEQLKNLVSTVLEATRGIVEDPVDAAIAGVSLGLSLVRSLGVGLIKGLDGIMQQFLHAAFSSLNALSGAGLGAALLGLFFVPSGIPQAIAGFVPLLIAGLSTAGLFERLQSWLMQGFDTLLQAVDQRFGSQEWLHRLRDVFGQIDQSARSLGTVLSTLSNNVLVRLAAAFALLWPMMQSFGQGITEVYRAGGIGAVLAEVIIKVKSLAPLLQNLRQLGTGLATPVLGFIQSIKEIATTFPIVQRLITMLGSVMAIASRLSAVQQFAAGTALAIGAGRRIMSAAAPAARAGQQMVVTGMDRVIQLMLWIGAGVYQFSKGGVDVARKVPLILKILSRILGVSSKILNPLPALISLSSGAMGRNGLPRITPIDILGRILPNFLISEGDKAVSGTKVRGILEQRQAGFGGLDPFKQRELVTGYTQKIASPLSLLNTPLFGPVAIASIELLGGALLSLVGILGAAAAALYIFKPQAAGPIFAVLKGIGAAITGVVFVLTHLGRSADQAGKTLDVLGLKMAAPGWAIATTRSINAVIQAFSMMAIAITNIIDFTLGIVPTLVRGALLLVPLAIVGAASLLLQGFRGLLSRVMSDTLVLTYGIVQAFQSGDWTALGDILKHGFINAFNVTLRPVGEFVKFVFLKLILSPIAFVVGGIVGLVGKLFGVIASIILHPVHTLRLLVGAVLSVGAALQAIRFAAILSGMARAANTVMIAIESLESSTAAIGGVAAVAAAGATAAIAPMAAAIGAAILLAGALAVEYRRGFQDIQQVLTALQHPIDLLNDAVSGLIHLITTPIKPFDWLFKPMSDFLGGLGQQFLKYFPMLIGVVFGLNILRKGLVKGMVSGFMTIVKAIGSITQALFGTIGAMVTLGRKSRKFSQSFKGQLLQESAKRVGTGLLARGGIKLKSSEPLEVQQERDRQFKEKVAISRFQQEIAKEIGKAEREYAKKLLELNLPQFGETRDVKLLGVKVGQYRSVTKEGEKVAAKAVAQYFQQGNKQFSDENLKAIAQKVGLNIAEIPGVGSLRELAAAKASKMEEIQDLYSQSIDNIRKAEMRVESAQVEIVAKSIQTNASVASMDNARARKAVGAGRKLSTMDDVLDLPFLGETIQQFSKMQGGEGLARDNSTERLIKNLQAMQDTRGDRDLTLKDVSLDTVRAIAQGMGVFEPKSSKSEGYRFMTNYEGKLDKQGIPAVTKQLLMLQMLAKTGQLAVPEQLAGAFSNPAESLKAIHESMQDFQAANQSRDPERFEALAEQATKKLQSQFQFMEMKDLKDLATSVSQASGPEDVIKILAQVLSHQVEMVLEQNPVVQVGKMAEQAAHTIDATAEQITQQSQAVERTGRSSGIKGFFEAVLGRVQQIRRDINDSDFVTRIRENARQAERDRFKAAQSAHIKSKVASISQSIGAGGAVDFMQRVGAIQDPKIKAIESAEMSLGSGGRSKEDNDLLYRTIKTLTTTSAKDALGKLDPKVLAQLTTYARSLDPNLSVQGLIEAMQKKGSNLSEASRQKLLADLSGMNKQGLTDFLSKIGVVSDDRSEVAKKYQNLIDQEYRGTIQKIQSKVTKDLDPQVKQALTRYAQDVGNSLDELIDNISHLGDGAIATVLREAGVIKELKDPTAIEKFLQSAGFKAAPMSLDSPEAKAIARLMRGDVSGISTKVSQEALRMIARAGNIDVAQLVDPSVTGKQLGEARKLRSQKLVSRSGFQMAELQQALELGAYDFEALLSGKTYSIQPHNIERVVKALGYQDREEFEQAMSALTLLQENRAGILRQIGNFLAKQTGDLTGFTQVQKAQSYGGQLQRYRQQLTRATTEMAAPSAAEISASLAPQRQAGLKKALAQSGQTQRQFLAELKDLGLTDVFQQFMQTGQWAVNASAQQIELIQKSAFGKKIRPEQLAALRQGLQKNGLTDLLMEYLHNGKFLSANTKRQEKLMNILQGTIGKIDEKGLEDLQHFLRDNELTQYLTSYLKTGEFVANAAAHDRKAIAAALMGKNATVEDLERLHENIPVGRFERLKISFQIFAMELRENVGTIGEAIATTLEKTPLRPASQSIIQSFQKFQNRLGETMTQVQTRLSKSSVGKNLADIRRDYQRARGRSLQGMVENAGFSSLEEFVTTFRAQMQQKNVPEVDINRELLAVLSPSKEGLKSGLDQGGMKTRQTTLKVMSDLLGLVGAEREKLGAAGGYTTDAVEPIQTYFVKRLPRIIKDVTVDVMAAAGKAAGRAGIYGVKLAIQRFSPNAVRNAAQFAQRIGFDAANSVNRIREYFAGSRFSKMLLPLENALDLRSRQAGHFLNQQAEDIANLPPPIPMVERVQSLFQSLAQRFAETVDRLRRGISSASEKANRLFAPIRNVLSGLFGMVGNAVSRSVAAARSAVGKARDTIAGGMMGRYSASAGLAEVEKTRRDRFGRPTGEQNFKESYGNTGVRLRSAKGRFLLEDEAVSVGSQRALMRQGGTRQRPVGRAPSPPSISPPSIPMFPDPWQETNAERFFKGISAFLRALKRVAPEVEAQTVEFFRSVNEGGDRVLRSVETVPLLERIKATVNKRFRSSLEGLARISDRRAGINPPTVKTPETPRIAGLLPPAGGMPTQQSSQQTATGIMRPFVEAAKRAQAAWARTGEEISGKTWRTMVQRAYRTGLRILGFISEASPGPSRQIRQNYAHTAEAVAEDFDHMEAAAKEAGSQIATTMQHAAKGAEKAGLAKILGGFGQNAMKIGGAAMAIGGALGSATFAAQSIGFSLTNLGLLDEESSQAIYRFTELISIFTTIGGVVTPIIGAIVSTVGTLVPILVTIGTAIGTFLISPVGLATAAIIGAIVLANEAAKRFLGVDILAPILSRVWSFAQQVAAPLRWAADWVEQRWQGLRDRFAPLLEPIVMPALAVAQRLINALNHNPTEVIPLAWEGAVLRIIEWIGRLPGIGGWAAQQLKDTMQPAGWLAGALTKASQLITNFQQNFAVTPPQTAKKKVSPPSVTFLPPPEFNLAEQMGDRLSYFQRGGGLMGGLTPGLQQAAYGVKFLRRSFREFGGEAFDALKRLDFAAIGSSAQKFGDRAGFALGAVAQGFRSMSLSAVAFGIASLVGLGPVNLVLIGMAALVLAIATNFLGLRGIVVGGLRILIGLLRVTTALVTGLAQVVGGVVKTVVGAIALLGGNLTMIREGIAMIRGGLEAIATGVTQGLREAAAGALQAVQGLLQGLRQSFGLLRGTVAGVWTALRGIGSTVKAIGTALMTALTKPQEAWERFLGVANRVANVVRRISGSPGIAVDTLENVATGKAPTVREGYEMAEFDDRLAKSPREAFSNLSYSASNALGSIAPQFAAPVTAVAGLVDGVWGAKESFGELKDSYEALQPAIQKGVERLKMLGFQNGFAAGMTKLLAIAQAGLAKTMAIVGVAAKFMWKAMTGPLAPLIIGVGLVVAAIVALALALRRGGLMEALRPFREAWYIISDAVGDVFNGIGIALNQLANALMLPFEPLLNLFGVSGGGGLGGMIANVFRVALSPIQLIAKAIGLVIRVVGVMAIAIIQVATAITRTLLLPVAAAIAWIVQTVQGAGRGIVQGFGSAIANIARPIAQMFGAIGITLRNVGDSLLEPFEPLLQMFGTSGAGGLAQLLGNTFKLLLTPLGLISSVVGLVVRLVGVVLVGALRLVGEILKPIAHALVAPVLLLGQMMRGIVGLAQMMGAIAVRTVQMLWGLMPPPLRWVIEVASKGIGLLTGAGASSAEPKRFAQGGLVTGPGGGDRIPALLQRDEFVMTAAATRQNYGFLNAINSGVPAEEALQILPTTGPAMVQPLPVATGTAIAAESAAPVINVTLNFNGNIVLSGGSGPELADEMMQHLEPRMEIVVREALRNMVERMR